MKTGSDSDAGLVDLTTSTSTTIAHLDGLTAPSTKPANARVAPTEDTVFKVKATLKEYKREADSGYHLVLADSSGNTMIGEIPDPACVASSSAFLADITTARSEFNAKYSPTSSFKTAGVSVTVTGVGFFDYDHGQTGVAPNAIELHSVLGVTFD